MAGEVHAVMRTEKKYSVSLSTSRQLANRLSRIMQTDAHGSSDGYTVRSLYFDSVYDDDYFDKVNGLEFRKKVRLRLYSPEQPWIKLEVKQKQGAVQMKKSLVISRELAFRMIGGEYFGLLELEGAFPRELYTLLEQGLYRPKCIVEYRRLAFVGETNNIRITIDSHLGASRKCGDFFAGGLSLQALLKEPTLEVKYDGFLLDYCKGIINLTDLPELSLSKYEMARRQVF